MMTREGGTEGMRQPTKPPAMVMLFLLGAALSLAFGPASFQASIRGTKPRSVNTSPDGVSAGVGCAAGPGARPVRVLILSGQNNHDWKTTTPKLSNGATVLASSYSAPDKEGTGEWESAALAGRFGDGRSFTLLLGHDAESMDNPGFRRLLRRGVEWAAIGLVEATAGAAAKMWRWEKEDNASLALVGPAGLLWRFRYGPALDVPHFHPLNTADGRTMTWDRPPDHIWHHGLWFSWKFINKVNYWEIDPKTGRPAGRTSWKDVKVTARDDHAARIAICDHPQNPRNPTPWYVIRSAEMSFFTPALICYSPMNLQPGERITLRYRVLVHPGRWDAARLRKEYERFSRGSREFK
jgi:hypothetical protein